MPSTAHLVAFAVTSLVLVAVPGPSVMFTISRALTAGRRAALFTVLGNAVGVYLQVIAVAVGLGTLMARSVVAFTVIKLVGAAYLIYLGVQALRHRHRLSRDILVPAPASAPRRTVFDGFVVGLANPKTIVFFAAALPQFVDRGAGDVPGQLLILGALFPLIALVCDSIWAVAAGTARSWLARSPRRLAALGGASGLTMIGIGAGLAVSGRTD